MENVSVVSLNRIKFGWLCSAIQRRWQSLASHKIGWILGKLFGTQISIINVYENSFCRLLHQLNENSCEWESNRSGEILQLLGVNIYPDGTDMLEVESRITMARQKFVDKKGLMVGDLKLSTKVKLLKLFFWSVYRFAPETWAIIKALKNKVAAL